MTSTNRSPAQDSPTKTPIVYDVNVLVDAYLQNPDPYNWPRLPPKTRSAAADCVGVTDQNAGFSLWLSPHILNNTRRVLIDKGRVSEHRADEYLDVLEEIAIASGGDVVEPRPVPEEKVLDCTDHEDNYILDLAHLAGAEIVVSHDADLTSMSGWRGTPILQPHVFASHVDGAWRLKQHQLPEKTITERMQERDYRRATRTANTTAAMLDHHPKEFHRDRERFDADLDRLAEIVDGWNPGSEQMKKRIAVWEKNITTFEKRVADLDDIVEGKPEIAHSALADLGSKLDFALDRLDPKRQARGPSLVDEYKSSPDPQAQSGDDQLQPGS
ncbi:PIN domain-containing protein [Nocardiopsis metallicus]|uniref:Uncharacterized protein YaiI (UPF0178 family) n=1 Tax=Nocardiopsis metallicus TaxID=179819 RepID=A0A840WEF0_9ACTN|nr:PIN domain-containing protein [Nocardiopsis metallicus]MBB5491391.1 uncharacterized protein YaiI (UPF0178 family) [Nocardiopsis metallicus]